MSKTKQGNKPGFARDHWEHRKDNRLTQVWMKAKKDGTASTKRAETKGEKGAIPRLRVRKETQ